MPENRQMKFGLIGTITHDRITYESGQSFEGIGGVLYQAATLCGLGKEVYLFTNLGGDLTPDAEKIIKPWGSLHKQGIQSVPGPGNRVFLDYPEKGEREETLQSVVPPLGAERIIRDLPLFDMLILVMNSGFDIELESWRNIVSSAACPIWFDVHSLALTREIGVKRRYRPLTEWKEWARNVHYLQANRTEVACMLGAPGEIPSEVRIKEFGEEAFGIGAKALFITLGKEGVRLVTPGDSKKIRSAGVTRIVDTTGCGDVFCAGTAAKLAEGESPFAAAFYGVMLASLAVGLSGVKETFTMASQMRTVLSHGV